MAQKIDRNPFTPFLNGFGFEQAFDGTAWKLSKGEDFSHAASTVAAALRDEHDRRFGRLIVKQEGNALIVQRIAGTST